MTQEMKLRLYKATVELNGAVEEVPVWAESLDLAMEQAEAAYGEVDRVRPAIAPDFKCGSAL